MHLGIHHTGQYVQALAIDHLAGGVWRERTDRCDAAIDHADIAHALAVLIDHGAGLKNGVKSLSHGTSYSVDLRMTAKRCSAVARMSAAISGSCRNPLRSGMQL